MANTNPAANRKKGPGKPPPAKRVTAEQREQEAEQALLRRLPPVQIARALATRWGVSERMAWYYIAKVRARWAREGAELSTEQGRLEARSHMRASLNDVYAKAVSARAPLKAADGTTLLDPKTNQPLYAEVPDLNNAIKAARLLVDLDGLAVPAKQAVQVSGTIGAVVADAGKATPAARASLEAWLTGTPASAEEDA